MKRGEFKRIAREAILRLPEMFHPHVDQIMIVLKPHASKRMLDELGVPEDEDLFGLYEGPALTERTLGDAPELPPRITLFYEPLLDYCQTEEELIHEIQVTVLHEIGHYFGLDDPQLEALGFG